MEIVEDLLGILACISAALIVLVCGGDYLTTGETANRYHIIAPSMLAVVVIKITGMTSGISYEHHGRVVSWLLSDGNH